METLEPQRGTATGEISEEAELEPLPEVEEAFQ
jgi:hypothetical protein